MSELFVRSRGLLVIVVLVLVAATCTVSTARAASSSPGAGSMAGARTAETASSSAPCNLRHTISKCQSTDPTVTVSTYAYGGSGGIVDCTFVWDFGWGDGHSSHATLTDPHVGWRVTAQHTYAKPGVYTMTATGEAIGANCTLTPFIVTFTLLRKQAPRPSPKIHWSQTSGRPGKLVTLTGSGWAPGGVVQIHLPDKKLFIGITSWHVDSHGNWKESLAEGDAPPGKYKVSFSETSGHLKVTDSFTVIDPPNLTERFSNWVDACYHGKLKFDSLCTDALNEAAHLKLSFTSILSCVIELVKKPKVGIAICIIEDGIGAARWVYNTWQSWWTHKPGP
jgi:hypothetical protein